MPIIKLELGYDTYYETSVLKVEYYKSHEAFLNPMEYPHECFNMAGAININNSMKTNEVNDLLQVIQMYINHLLNYVPDKAIT